MEANHLCNFCKMGHMCEIISKSSLGFEKCRPNIFIYFSSSNFIHWIITLFAILVADIKLTIYSKLFEIWTNDLGDEI